MADVPYSFFETLCQEGELQDITDFITLGSAVAAKDAQALKRHRITHVLTVHPSLPFVFEKSLKYLRIPMPDAPFEMLSPYVPEVLEFLDEAKRRKGRVLVHCQKGISRSTAFVFVYLMRREKLSFEDAFKLVEDKRKQAFPNVGFQAQLLKDCRDDITPEEISADVLSKVHDRFDESKSYANAILKCGGVTLSQSKRQWVKLGLFFENLHKYKFVPRGGDSEKLKKEALETVEHLQSLGKVFSPSMEAVKLTQKLALEIEKWIQVVESHQEVAESSQDEELKHRKERSKRKKDKKTRKDKKKEKKKEKKKGKKRR